MPLLPSLRLQLPLRPVVSVQRWWRRLAPQRQDRFAVIAPLAAVLLFLAAIVSAFAYLRLEEIEREQEAVKRDVEYTQQRLRLRLLERQEQLMRLAREVSNRETDGSEFQVRAENLVNQYPELMALSWVDERRRIRSSYGNTGLSTPQGRPVANIMRPGETENIYRLARELQQPVYAQRPASPETPALLQLHIPLSDKTKRGFDVHAAGQVNDVL